MMCTNLGGSVLLSLCIQSLEWKGDILNQKLSICGRQFGYKEEQSSVLRGWGRESHHLKRWIFENANCYSHCRLIYQHSEPGWNRSVGRGLLKRKQKQMGLLLLGWRCSVVRSNLLCSPLAGAAGDTVKHRPRACGCKKWNACVAQGLRRKCVASHWDCWGRN